MTLGHQHHGSSRHNLELISLHIPKTAGNSFSHILRREYGRNAVFRFNANPKQFRAHGKDSIGEILPPDARALHGHIRYCDIQDLVDGREIPVIAWIRDPVERVISNWFYHMREVEQGNRDDPIDLLTFARRKLRRNVMTRYLAGHDLEKYAFIGLFECLHEDLNTLATFMGWKTPVVLPEINTTTTIRRKSPTVSEDEVSEVRSLNMEDVALHRQVLKLRKK